MRTREHVEALRQTSIHAAQEDRCASLADLHRIASFLDETRFAVLLGSEHDAATLDAIAGHAAPAITFKLAEQLRMLAAQIEEDRAGTNRVIQVCDIVVASASRTIAAYKAEVDVLQRRISALQAEATTVQRDRTQAFLNDIRMEIETAAEEGRDPVFEVDVGFCFGDVGITLAEMSDIAVALAQVNPERCEIR